jgi:hypothetical protein
MDETKLRALLDGATASEPPTGRPIGRIIADMRRGAARLKRRKLIGSTTASVAGVAVIAITASLASGALGNADHPSPANHFGRSGQMAYVLTYSGDVVPVNLATMKAGRPLRTGLDPGWRQNSAISGPDIVAARGGKALYVSTLAKPKIRCSAPRTCREYGRSAILPISTATGRIGRHITVAGNFGEADNLVSTPNGEVAYAMDFGLGLVKASAKLASIDLTTGTKLRQMSMPFTAMNQDAMSLNSRTLLLSGAGPGGAPGQSPGRQLVASVNVASDRASKAISLKFSDINQTCIGVSPDGATGYIALTTRSPGEVVPIDVAANKPLKAIKLPSVKYLHSEPGFCSMAVAPNGRTAYILVQRYVLPIDLVTGKVLKPIELPGWSPSWAMVYQNIAIDPNGTMAYALTGLGVTPINLATDTALPVVRLSHGANFVSFSPDGRTALVSEGPDDDALLPIQAATGKAGKPIRLPGPPDTFVVTP